MKKQLLIAALILLPASAKNGTNSVAEVYYIRQEISAALERQTEAEYIRLMEGLGQSENSGRWQGVNEIGAIGKYQFMSYTLRELGIDIVPSDFERDPEIFPESVQDSIMLENIKRNEKYLREIIEKHSGDTLECGAVVTKDGILAAAHLAGRGGVKRYFEDGYNARDKNGTSVEDYIVKFQKQSYGTD